MKIVTGDILNKMPAGTMFAELTTDRCWDELGTEIPMLTGEHGNLTQILTTLIGTDGESFICRTDDGCMETEESYSHEGGSGIGGYEGPLVPHWGTNSVGCFGKDTRYMVLDDVDKKLLIQKLQSKPVPRWVGTEYVGTVVDYFLHELP